MSAQVNVIDVVAPKRRKRILFIHQNFSGQFARIAADMESVP